MRFSLECLRYVEFEFFMVSFLCFWNWSWSSIIIYVNVVDGVWFGDEVVVEFDDVRIDICIEMG